MNGLKVGRRWMAVMSDAQTWRSELAHRAQVATDPLSLTAMHTRRQVYESLKLPVPVHSERDACMDRLIERMMVVRRGMYSELW